MSEHNGLPLAEAVPGTRIGPAAGSCRDHVFAPEGTVWTYPRGAAKAHLVLHGARLALCGFRVGALSRTQNVTYRGRRVCPKCAELTRGRSA